MSSPMNNNLPIQSSIPQTNTTEFAGTRPNSSVATNAGRSQRGSRDKLNILSRGSHNYGRGRGRQVRQFEAHDSVETRQLIDHGSSADHPATSNEGRVTGYRPQVSRQGYAKHKQRIQSGQLIEGMDNLSGLDIDLAESIVPTGSSNCPGEVRRQRHPTNLRKVNLTHILNNQFERPSRGGRYRQSNSHGDNSAISSGRNQGSQYRTAGNLAHKFSKQQFLQANCQFVVLDGHDYSVHKADSDWPVDWDRIEEVKFKQVASTQTTCPICLDPPTAAKITRCGHIYCWTCMLHYLSLSDEKCRQCPICFEFVYERDLRSVVPQLYTNYSAEDEIDMQLMVRRKGCVEVEPYRSLNSTGCQVESTSNSCTDHYGSQANLVIVDPLTVVTKIAQRERDELLVKYAIDRDEPEVCFIDQALDKLQHRVAQLHEKNNERRSTGKTISHARVCDSEPSKTYMFYQCSDGQHIYLNPFSTKILCHEYSSLENCPTRIKAKILQMDWISMNEAWRRRFRYLEHLPLTCEFRLIEIDFRDTNLISTKTYEFFKDQIKNREQQRQLRLKEERKREKIIRVEQDRAIYGIQPALKINLDNIDQFPSVSDERYLGLSRQKLLSKTSDEEISDDDEYDTPIQDLREPADQHVSETLETEARMDTPDVVVDSQPDLVLSFQEIQIQEAALASREYNKAAPTPKSNWGSRASSSGAGQSSFAQLLVDAKTSSKNWSKICKPNRLMESASKQEEPKPTSSSNRADSEGDDEELRAPPFQFNMSDFIDLSSSPSKKKGKSKGLTKKR